MRRRNGPHHAERLTTRLPCALLLLVTLAACAAEDPADRVESRNPDTVAAMPARPADPGFVVAGDSTQSPPLTPDGWGALRIGMSRAELVAAAGEDANPEAVGGPEPELCDEFRPARAPQGMMVMVERGRLTRITLLGDADIETEQGVGLGDSTAAIMAALQAAYGEAVTSTPHYYLAPPAHYLTVWTTPPPSPEARGLHIEIGVDGRATRIHAGGASIESREGCV